MAEKQADFFEPSPFELTSRQQQVADLLRAAQTPKYPFSNWYLGAIYAAKNSINPDRFSQSAQSIRELIEKLPRVLAASEIENSRPDFRRMRDDMNSRLISAKERYGGKWNGKTIDDGLEEMIHILEYYLKQSEIPYRIEQAHSLISTFDPMYDTLDSQIKTRKPQTYNKLRSFFEGVAHHKASINEDYFWKQITVTESLIIDLLAPVTAQDQGTIQALLSKQQPDDDEVEILLELIKRRGANYAFFFKTADNPFWIIPLKENGFFNTPPDAEVTEDGSALVPYWWPIEYLKKVSSKIPREVVEIILGLEKINNPRILREILSIACDLPDISLSLRLFDLIKQYLDSPHWWGDSELIVKIIQKWGYEYGASLEAALEIIRFVVEFLPDPEQAKKSARRIENPQAWDTTLEPTPRLEQWEYQQVVEKGVRYLSEQEPLSVARILIDATTNMIRMKMHEEDLEKGLDEDLSEFWCRRLNTPDPDIQDVEQTLVNTLTYACEQVYGKNPDSISALDQVLRSQRWKVFKRLRQHLYALHPNDQTLPWIRELILGYDHFSKWENHFEMQLMIQKSSEHFGFLLLTPEEQSSIFDAILSGPSKDDYRKHMGDQYSDELFKLRQRNFHRRQLRPFAPILTGEYQRYFDELESEKGSKAITDDDYLPVGDVVSGTVSYRSPKSKDELLQFTDDELLSYLNDWEEEHRDRDDWLLEINISALAHVFQILFKEVIVSNEERLTFWMTHRDTIARPIYIVAMVNAMQELVKGNQFDNLDQWLEFCTWVLSRPDLAELEDQPKASDESRDNPSWRSSRRAVVDLIDVCVRKDTNTPITARDGLANLLQLVCTQSDWQLDRDRPVVLNQNDPITEAINNTRSLSLESLIIFGLWIRRYLSEDSVPEVTGILSSRLDTNAEHPLTRPEYAILGKHFGNLCVLNRDWTIDHQENLFPRKDLSHWWDAFGNYIRFNIPSRAIFEVLRQDFEFAQDNLKALLTSEDENIVLVVRLGQYLFTYYLWKLLPLLGEESMLARFYNKTSDNIEIWARLFDTVGTTLSKHGQHWDKELIDRTIAYFDWRLETAEPHEVKHFTSWLEAECLDSQWRLQSYSKILDVLSKGDLHFYREVKALNNLLPKNSPLVVKCFAKITDFIDQSTQTYIPPEEAKNILRAGLNAADAQVRKDAEHAQENLLRHGRSGFLVLE